MLLRSYITVVDRSGESGTEIVARLKRDMLPTMINNVIYWPLCDFITFRFIPVHLQVKPIPPFLYSCKNPNDNTIKELFDLYQYDHRLVFINFFKNNIYNVNNELVVFME